MERKSIWKIREKIEEKRIMKEETTIKRKLKRNVESTTTNIGSVTVRNRHCKLTNRH